MPAERSAILLRLSEAIIGYLVICSPLPLSSASYVTRCQGKYSTAEEAVNITCDFPQNLNISKTSFAVYRYQSDHTVIVLLCHWQNGKVACYTEDEASTPESVSYQFTTSLHGKKKGEFSCETSPPDDSLITRCIPRQEGENTTESASTAQLSTCENKTGPGLSTERDGQCSPNPALIAVFCASIVANAVIVSFLCRAKCVYREKFCGGLKKILCALFPTQPSTPQERVTEALNGDKGSKCSSV